MSWYYNYDAKAAKSRVKNTLEKRRKKGEALMAVVPTAKRGLSGTFWGQAWNRNLESYSDYENRLPRGRTYLRQGCVLDLEIFKGQITSTVSGSELYDVIINISPLAVKRWKELKKLCTGKVGTLIELLSGKLSDEIMRHVTDHEHGLFPAPREIQMSCSCPDYADCCKHLAATLYAVGCKLDNEPALLFTLRGVDAQEMIGESAQNAVASFTTGGDKADTISDSDLADVFGISFDAPVVEEPPVAAKPKKVAAKKAARKKAAPSGHSAK
jgi:uncharacterized Zn finger protein